MERALRGLAVYTNYLSPLLTITEARDKYLCPCHSGPDDSFTNITCSYSQFDISRILIQRFHLNLKESVGDI